MNATFIVSLGWSTLPGWLTCNKHPYSVTCMPVTRTETTAVIYNFPTTLTLIRMYQTSHI